MLNLFQGQTSPEGTILVVHWSNRMQAGLAYVMLGRCQRLEDLFIVRDKYDVSKIRCCKEAKQESDNLDERAQERKTNCN